MLGLAFLLWLLLLFVSANRGAKEGDCRVGGRIKDWLPSIMPRPWHFVLALHPGSCNWFQPQAFLTFPESAAYHPFWRSGSQHHDSPFAPSWTSISSQLPYSLKDLRPSSTGLHFWAPRSGNPRFCQLVSLCSFRIRVLLFQSLQSYIFLTSY